MFSLLLTIFLYGLDSNFILDIKLEFRKQAWQITGGSFFDSHVTKAKSILSESACD